MRFEPDTLLDALLRPFAMAAPNANVYVEIMAPDFRFVFALLLVAMLAVALVRRLGGPRSAPSHVGNVASRPVLVLSVALAAAFTSWVMTTGNGRYFAAGLLVVGPVCVGLAQLLPVTRALRLTVVAAMVVLQAFAVQQGAPWGQWTVARWQAPSYFRVEIPSEWKTQPATYVTMSAMSYSLVAPQFHPQSRWLSLHNASPTDGGSWDAKRADALLAQAQPGRLMLLVPAIAGMQTADLLPNAAVMAAMGRQLAPYRLAFEQPGSCRFLPSASLAEVGLGEKTLVEREQSGFWLCHLTRTTPGPSTSRGRRYDAVFRVLEAQCPRFFPAGGDRGSLQVPDGEMRSYLQAEMKAYVYDNGEVYYKYYRALNPVLVGRADDLLSGRARVDCGWIRGRSGLPWDREI